MRWGMALVAAFYVASYIVVIRAALIQHGGFQ
jgi:hypothetical protein